jgi:hypothetical protein
MPRFLAGFAVASVLWGAFLFSYKQGWIDISLEPPAPPADETNLADTPQDESPGKPSHARKRRASPSAPRKRSAPSGSSTVGDDLREGEARNVNMGSSGGEEQLRGTEIEQGFDSVFGQIKRCLILAAGDEPAHGKLIFGLRISGDGKVNAVNLSGPSSVSQGDSGACLRKAAQSIHFRSFNGPDMVVHYPLTLE